jgi:hypothetical protein
LVQPEKELLAFRGFSQPFASKSTLGVLKDRSTWVLQKYLYLYLKKKPDFFSRKHLTTSQPCPTHVEAEK